MAYGFGGGLAAGGTAVGITFIAETEEARQKVNELYSEIQRGNDITIRLGDTAQQTSRQLMSMGRAIGVMRGFIAQASISSYVILLLMRRMRTSARRVRDTQQRLNEVTKEYGRYSLEARDALERYQDALEDAQYAQFEFGLQMIFLVGSVFNLIASLPQLIAALQTLKQALYGAAAAGIAAHAAIGPLGWLLLALGMGGAAAAGYYLATQQTGQPIRQQYYRQQRGP